MHITDFDFHLPDTLIALRPVSPRHAAKLLHVRTGHDPLLEDRHVFDLPGLLREGDALVFNNTKVIPARLTGQRIGRGETTPKIEVTLHKRVDETTWQGFAKPARKLEAGDQVCFGVEEKLVATVIEKGEAGEITFAFDVTAGHFESALAHVGVMPLPPYIASKRAPDAQDQSDYQTLFAKESGAVAAPTASLHFTDLLMEKLTASGVTHHFLTLHVGAGTFLPVKTEDTRDHKMHAEWGEISPETADALNEVKRQGGRIICAGTTSLRLLESATDENGTIRPFQGDTDIFITPGYRFRAADLLLTNFHLPKSTLFMLVSAYCGLEVMKTAYAHAIENGYRFYSYGDASLLELAK